MCAFDNIPTEGVVTYSTLGLSRHILNMPRARQVRQELLFSVAIGVAEDDFTKLLAHVGDGILRKHEALLRGDLINLGYSVAQGTRCDHLYVSLPVVFPDGLATCTDTTPPTVFAWLIPILPAEANFVAKFGWSEFESRLERSDPDLFDMGRSCIV
jgi:hypothetical protein